MRLRFVDSLLALMLVGEALAQGWVDRTPLNCPPRRMGHAMCYDPAHGYVLMAGGLGAQQGGAWSVLSDTWSWDGASWTLRATGGPQMTNINTSSGAYTAMAYYPPTNQVVMVMVQGNGGSPLLSAFTWDGSAWSAAGSLSGHSGWPAMIGLVADPVRGELVLYGITGYQGWSGVEIWDGATWYSRPAPYIPWTSSSTGALTGMAWDPSSSTVILASGESGPTSTRAFAWNGINWQQRLSPTRPPCCGAMTADIGRQCVVMVDGDYNSVVPYHTWKWSAAGFQQLSTAVEPSLRLSTALAYDPVRGVTVMFGGSINGNPVWTLADTWEFDMGAQAAYTSFGGGCLGSRGIPNIAPQAGSLPRIGSTFNLLATNMPWTGPAFLFLGLSNTSYSGMALPADLGFLGAPNCAAMSSCEELHVITNVLGSGTWSFPVPPYPGLTFYNQLLPLDPGANSLGLTVSNGGRGVIGL